MTVPRFNAVGFCAHYSQQGDWAFYYAMRLAQENDLQLNVFHFLSDPYDPEEDTEVKYTRAELSQLAFEQERELRLYYDERAGDFLNVGFRLCFDDSWRELHRCLADREFQVLVLAVPEAGAKFSRKSIEVFADNFVCPVILVGPDRPDQFRLNSSAALWSEKFAISENSWDPIENKAV